MSAREQRRRISWHKMGEDEKSKERKRGREEAEVVRATSDFARERVQPPPIIEGQRRGSKSTSTRAAQRRMRRNTPTPPSAYATTSGQITRAETT